MSFIKLAFKNAITFFKSKYGLCVLFFICEIAATIVLLFSYGVSESRAIENNPTIARHYSFELKKPISVANFDIKYKEMRSFMDGIGAEFFSGITYLNYPPERTFKDTNSGIKKSSVVVYIFDTYDEFIKYNDSGIQITREEFENNAAVIQIPIEEKDLYTHKDIYGKQFKAYPTGVSLIKECYGRLFHGSLLDIPEAEYEHFNIELNKSLTPEKSREFINKTYEIFDCAEVPDYFFPSDEDLLKAQQKNFEFLIVFAVMIFAAFSLCLFFNYFIEFHSDDIRAFWLMGATKVKISVMYTIENAIFYTIGFLLGVFLFETVVKEMFHAEYFPSAGDSYGFFNYLTLYLIYLIITVIISYISMQRIVSTMFLLASKETGKRYV